MHPWFLYLLVVLQLSWGLFLWVLSFVGLAPGFVDTYTGITSPLNYTWYSLAGAAFALVVSLIAAWGWWWSPYHSASDKSKSFTHARMHFQIARASFAFFLLYGALFGFLGSGVSWVSNYSNITLTRLSVAPVVNWTLVEYYSTWMSILSAYIFATTVVVFWSIYIFFFGHDTGIVATATAVTKGIGAKSGKSKKNSFMDYK